MSEWYDRDLVGSPHGVVVPALGALAPGHVLVSPREHAKSVQDLALSDRNAFIDLLDSVCERLADLTTKSGVTVFEHGAAIAGSGPRSACTEHAHVQVLPGEYELTSSFGTSGSFSSLRAFYRERPPFYPYLMARDGGDVLIGEDVGESQFFRREILRKQGDPDRWDYWLFQRDENLRATLELFYQR